MKIVTVCGMGLGTSLMLKMTVDKVLKDKGIKATVEACDIGVINSMDADLIITNPEFASKIQHPKAKVVSVKNIASQQEVSKLFDDLLTN